MTRTRLAVATLLAVLAAHYTFTVSSRSATPSDFAQMWVGARVLLHGGNPYDAIGPGRAFDFRWPLYYPLTGVVAVVPVALLSYRAAVTCVAALGVFALAWTLTATGYGPLLGFASVGAWSALYRVQWSPLLVGGIGLAPLSVLWIAKPTIGLACFAARPTRWAVFGALLLLVIAFALDPTWPVAWWGALGSSNVAPTDHAGHFAAVQFQGGVLVFAALTRWRRWDARLLVALACVPQTMLFYETVPLLLIPRGWRESATFAALGWGVLWWVHRHGALTFVGTTLLTGQAITLALYLPATLFVLRRPNEGSVPAWLEYGIRRWPTWARGSAGRGSGDSAPRPTRSTTGTASSYTS